MAAIPGWPYEWGGHNRAPLYTVPLKGKLTVSTRNLILDPRSFRESRIEFQGLSFKDRESSFKVRVSSFETLEEFFEDLEQRF